MSGAWRRSHGKAPTKSRDQAPKFLFINKDISSRSLSNSRADRGAVTAIRRHAHRQSKPWDVRDQEEVPFAVSRTRLNTWQSTLVTDLHSPASSHHSSDDSVSSEISDSDFVVESPDSVSSYEVLDQYEASPSPVLSIISTRPLPCLDSIASMNGYLDYDKQFVFQYFTQVRLPWKTSLPPGSHINSLVPIWPDDTKHASEIVSMALQSQDKFAMNSLLAVTSRRMRLLTGVSFQRGEAPEEYTVNAIQALRRHIRDGSMFHHEAGSRSLLWLSYLTLAEFYVRDATRINTYFSMMRQFAAFQGGFGKMHSYDVHFALAADLFISANTVSKPELDVFMYPELLGISSVDTDNIDIVEEITQSLSQLEPRMRSMYQQNHFLMLTMEAVHSLRPEVVRKITSFTKSRVHLFPLQSLPLSTSGTTGNGAASFDTIAAVDNLYIQLRSSAFQVWLWYSAISFMAEDEQATVIHNVPTSVQMFSQDLSSLLDSLDQALSGTKWFLHNDMTLWTAALGFLITRPADGSHAEDERYFVNAALALNVSSQRQLGKILMLSLPLHRIEPHWLDILWSLVDLLAWSESGSGFARG